MPRNPEPRSFESRKGYYCQFTVKEHHLASGPDARPTGPTYFRALDVFRWPMDLGSVEEALRRRAGSS